MNTPNGKLPSSGLLTPKRFSTLTPTRASIQARSSLPLFNSASYTTINSTPATPVGSNHGLKQPRFSPQNQRNVNSYDDDSSVPPSPISSAVNTNVITSIRICPTRDVSNSIWTFGALPSDPLYRSFIRNKSQNSSVREFVYNNVFDMYTSNFEVYQKSVYGLVQNVYMGYNGIVFAYGMTGTGKTYSMQGQPGADGMIPLAVRDLFELVERNSSSDTFQIHVSYLEIYNERIRDLITNSSEEPRIRENANGEVTVTPVERVLVTTPEEVNSLIEQCVVNRKTAETDFNKHSSRSHAILQIFLTRNITKEGKTVCSNLSLVDLAGSERASSDMERRKEGAYINKSLLTLGTVISRLSATSASGLSSSNNSHIPFRDSKLTRLLQRSLSGNALISLLATISIEPQHALETTNTLKFALRTQNIPLDVKRSEGNSDVQTELSALHIQLKKKEAENEYLTSVIAQLSSDLEQRDSYIAMLETERSQGAAINRVRMRMEELLSDRDLEIADLKAELQDKDRIIHALRFAQKQREIAEYNNSQLSLRHPSLESYDPYDENDDDQLIEIKEDGV
ncbi:kinesin-like protein Tea2 [Schizosaccharomyces japonicus yFS275]|uniref:Kinesin-like protein Tea2 n=1 Tax=Schizosaccharomyces japonicus (strain yFS275 / FY16936) TaxID=402676 RepID=B6JWS5_SCHJY|nr:kinesin-like protein Tea2 [Schizosaccharomyces japonicus yFS275]EEB05826.1 kinesin-like protein Tea2 [Schizosaccharomyces japonicus yFS275]